MARVLVTGRENYRVATGSYTGSGSNMNVTSLGFTPTLVIIQGSTNVATFRTDKMPNSFSIDFGGAGTGDTGAILRFLSNGFRVGTSAKVNTNGTTYRYLAFFGADNTSALRTLVYVGNGVNARQLTDVGIGFRPDIFFTKAVAAQSPSARISTQVGDTSFHISGAADASDEIEAFLSAGGAQLGQAMRVNADGTAYYGSAFKNISGVLTNGSYAGTGSDNLAVTVGFQPDWVIVKQSGTNSAIWRTTAFPANTAAGLAGLADATTYIKTFTSTGFTVGTSAAVNNNGDTYWWIAGRTGDYNVTLSRTAAANRTLATGRVAA